MEGSNFKSGAGWSLQKFDAPDDTRKMILRIDCLKVKGGLRALNILEFQLQQCANLKGLEIVREDGRGGDIVFYIAKRKVENKEEEVFWENTGTTTDSEMDYEHFIKEMKNFNFDIFKGR